MFPGTPPGTEMIYFRNRQGKRFTENVLLQVEGDSKNDKRH